MRIGITWTVLMLAVAAAAGAAASATPFTGEWISVWLVLDPTGQPGRNPIVVDDLEAELAERPFIRALVSSDRKPRRWTPARVGEDGWLQHAALRGGHAYTVVDADAPRTMVLEASGHRWVECNGVRSVGDPYQAGFVRVPVRLCAGSNYLLFGRVRGRVRARLIPMRGVTQFNDDDLTIPDAIIGDHDHAGATLNGAVVLINGGSAPLNDASIVARVEGGQAVHTAVPVIERMTVRKVPFLIGMPRVTSGGKLPVQLELRRNSRGSATLDTLEFNLRVRHPDQPRKRTFISDIDGSVQYYAVQPSTGDGPQALFFTLHGASVEAIRQARAYTAKSWGHVVAPTNRRPFGFDWEDWGRWDALEVLARATRSLDIDPARIYLTGHSMGGHGTWHLGVTFPDRFAAIGPSAGWASFWSYAGADRPASDDAIEAVFRRATHPSDTLALAGNLQPLGVYVLHGDWDDNVPVEQARLMRPRLAEFHPDFAYYERPGAGHWWGDQCVDWPEMFAYFQCRERQAPSAVRQVRFRTASPGVSAASDWLRIEMQATPLAFSDVAMDLDVKARTFTATTTNVTRMALNLHQVTQASEANEQSCLATGAPVHLALDGMPPFEAAWPENGTLYLRQGADGWNASPPAPMSWKGPHRYGPFKQVFRNRVLLVYGTAGVATENAWALAKARLDAETFWYRGNGSFTVIADVDYDPIEHAGRNVVLYGHAESNAAWPRLLASSPVQVHRNRVQVGEQVWTGDDLAVLLLRPAADDDRALVGVVGGSGMPGMRATAALPYFVSGVAYPDCTVLRTRALREGIQGVVCAGYFGERWDIASGTFATRSESEAGDR